MPLKSFTAAERIVTERRRMEWPLLVLIAVTVISYALTERRPESMAFYLLAGLVAGGINLLAVLQNKEVYLRRLLVNIGVLLATGILLGELFLVRHVPIVAFTHWLLLILLCKLFEHKTNRDYAQMLGMSLLVMISCSMISREIYFAPLLLVYLVLAVYCCMVLTLKRGLDAAASSVLASELEPMAPKQVAWNVTRQWPRGALLWKVLGVMALVLNLAVCSFLFLPRVPLSEQTNMLGDADQASGEVGFNGQVVLRNASRLYLSDQVVMRVRLVNEPAEKDESFGYLRGVTFETYS